MGFFDDPRSRRLKKDYQEMLKLQSESDILEIQTSGDAPEDYDLTFHGKILAGTRPIKFTEKNKAQFTLGSNYPRTRPDIRWTTPIVHPNIQGSAVCFGNFVMSPMVKLTEICEILWDLARLAMFNAHGGYIRPEEWYPLMKTIPGGVPTDPRILRNKAPAAPKASPGPAEPEGDIFVIEGSRPRMGADFTRADVDRLRRDVEEYLRMNNLDLNTRVFTTEEWLRRGEKYGEGSILTITTAGDLGWLLNGMVEGWENPVAEMDQWNEFLGSLGLWWDLGHAWSVHLYPAVEGPWLPRKGYGVKAWRPR